jgi:hypothetical protein
MKMGDDGGRNLKQNKNEQSENKMKEAKTAIIFASKQN